MEPLTDFATVEERVMALLTNKSNAARQMMKAMNMPIRYGTQTGRWSSCPSSKLWLDFETYRRQPVFTKQHYEAIAGLIAGQRVRVRDDKQMDTYQKAAAMNEINHLTVGFVQLFKSDNKKFKDLLFIGECDKHAGTSTEPQSE